MEKKKTNKFFKNTFILVIAGILVKIIGAVYRIPITNIIMDTGIGYYQAAYPVYQILLTISTAGLPIAVAKLVSENYALGRVKAAHKVFRESTKLMFILGIASALFVYVFSHQIVGFLQNENSWYSLVALIPALIFAPLMSSFRGFYQGKDNMVPTAISQVIEQLFKLIFGLMLTKYALKMYGVAVAAGAAQSGGSIGAFFGFLFLLIVFLFNYKSYKEEERLDESGFIYDDKEVIRDILAIAVPITIGASINPLMDFIDTKLVFMRLTDIGYTMAEANDMFGWLKGMATTLINMPQAISIALSMSIVPLVSAYMVKNDHEKMHQTIYSGLKFTCLFAFPCALGFIALSKPIISLIYYNNSPEAINGTAELLSILSISLTCLCMIQILTAILQAVGSPEKPVKNLVIGSLVKIVLTYILTGISYFNVKGAAISTDVAFLVAMVLNYIDLEKIVDKKYNLLSYAIKVLAISIIMAVSVKIVYELLSMRFSLLISTSLSISFGIIVYAGLALLLKLVKIEDFITK